jgi:hypothetical protein
MEIKPGYYWIRWPKSPKANRQTWQPCEIYDNGGGPRTLLCGSDVDESVEGAELYRIDTPYEDVNRWTLF